MFAGFGGIRQDSDRTQHPGNRSPAQRTACPRQNPVPPCHTSRSTGGLRIVDFVTEYMTGWPHPTVAAAGVTYSLVCGTEARLLREAEEHEQIARGEPVLAVVAS